MSPAFVLENGAAWSARAGAVHENGEADAVAAATPSDATTADAHAKNTRTDRDHTRRRIRRTSQALHGPPTRRLPGQALIAAA
jgi:hypothetical protein